MRYVQLSSANCRLLGLVPSGMVRAQVYGLDRVKRQHGGWLFAVVEPWRLDLVRQVCAALTPGLGTPSVGAALVRRLAGGCATRIT